MKIKLRYSWIKKSFAVSIVFMLFITSCTKIITVKLDEAPTQYVIEGTISNRVEEPATVRISQTKKFEEDNSFAGISGAKVSIQVNGGTIYNLSEDSTGVYQTTAFTGVPGTSYNLTVLLNGITYTSTSVMPLQIVPLDSITAENIVFAGNSTIAIYPNYKDPPGIGNSYRLVEYKNGVQVKFVFEQNDDLSDGLVITRPLINPDSDLASGDTIRVDLQCIDPDVYKYWFSLDQAATGQNQSATPTNPVTNIAGGALGYFSAYSVTSKTIIIL